MLMWVGGGLGTAKKFLVDNGELNNVHYDNIYMKIYGMVLIGRLGKLGKLYFLHNSFT